MKVSTPHPAIDLRIKAEKLTWVGRFASVPVVLRVDTGGPVHWRHTAYYRRLWDNEE